MTPRSLIIALALSLLPSASYAAGNDFREWIAGCTPGSDFCVSWTLRLEYEAALAERTRATLTVTNYQGSPGHQDLDPFGASFFQFDGLAWTPPAWWGTGGDLKSAFVTSGGEAGTVDYLSPNTVVPVSGSHSGWEVLLNQSSSGSAWMSFQEAAYTGWWSIFGCDGPTLFGPGTGTGVFHWYESCGAQSSIALYVDVFGELGFDDSPDTCAFMFGIMGDGSFQPRTERCLVATVPEPSSLLLVASGVFGLAYVRRRRAA